jgi:succinate dehydrogenase / fumarate reductase cytochrome b subunit
MTATALPASRTRRLGLLGTTIGKKLVVAVTGLGWIGFVFGHMIGNLKMFLGPTHLNEYGEWLRSLGEPAFPRTVVLWVARSGLIAMFFAHVALVYLLAVRNRRSRPVRYSKAGKIQADPASLMMKWGGVTIFAFIFFHLAHFTWGVVPGEKFNRGDPYGNVTNAFYHRPVIGIIYLVAMIALAGHIYHGFWSTMQTLGLNRKRFDRLFRAIAWGLVLVIVGGNVAIIAGATFLQNPGT